MNLKYFTFLFLSIVLMCSDHALANTRSLESKRFHRGLTPIDPAGTFFVEYEADLNADTIRFTVVVQTVGFVGFGLSPNGGMTGADIVIGGVFTNGDPYFSDRHGIGTYEPVIDESQDWTLELASQNETHTSLVFSRALNTCDDQDIPITKDTISIIWSYGTTDSIGYHGATNRGSYSVNLLDPTPEFDSSLYDRWTMIANSTLPSARTSYHCTIHRSPQSYSQTRHAVAFDIRLENELAVRHTHNIVLFRCTAPVGLDPDKYFGPLLGTEGGDCYAPVSEQPIPYSVDCHRPIYTWAAGARIMTFPDVAGFPITAGGMTEYIMLHVHYDNPWELEGIRIESYVEIYSTENLRPYNAGLFIVGHDLTYSHFLPPRTEAYVTVGHCSSDCMQQMVLPSGIQIFNIFAHAHLTGRKMKLRHFRNGTELPWLLSDDNYDFNYQQARPLREHVTVLPGDHLTTECTHNTMDRAGVTLSGRSPYEEMCQVHSFYYPEIGGSISCFSAYDEDKLNARLGLEEVWWDGGMGPPIVLRPEQYANRTLPDVIDSTVAWTPELVRELQEETRYHYHYQSICSERRSPAREDKVYIGYPDVDKEYEEEDPCHAVTTSPPVTGIPTTTWTPFPSRFQV